MTNYFFMARAKQVTMTTISQPDILPLLVARPPLPEQERIVRAYDCLDEREQMECRRMTKFISLKQGLMQDLLTGRVRVTNLQEMST
ncbi:MAG: restriction endonuclease subunit S [Syntrophobacteraceae bacterium]